MLTEPSRLGRGRAYSVAEYEVAGLGVRIESASGRAIAPNEETPGISQILDLIWGQRTSQMTKTKLRKMAFEGYFLGGKVPFGFRTETVPDAIEGYSRPPKRLVPNEAVSPVVRNAYELYIKHNSLHATLNFLKVETSEAWSGPRTKRFLSNPAYEVIVGTEVFQEVQRLLTEKVFKGKQRKT